MPSECNAARSWAVCSRRSLRLRAQEPPPHPDQRLDQSPGAHPCQGPLRMLQRRLLLGKPRTKGTWRWTTSCPGTRAVRTTSATCRPSASAAMPASDGRRETGCVFCALEASGRVLLENELALCIADAYPVTPGHSLVIPRRHGSRNKIRWAGTVRWNAARPQEPAWPTSDHGWPASSARSLH